MLISKKKKKLNSKPVYNENFLKTKIKSYGDEATDFHDNKISKSGSKYSAWILLLKKMKAIILKCFKKNANILKNK